MFLDLGAGTERRPGWIRLDKSPLLEPDIVCELGREPIPLPDDSVRGARAIHLLEHIPNLMYCMEELWRVMRHGASLYIKVPDAHSPNLAWRDPTHVRAFVPETFYYWDKEHIEQLHYTDKPWQIRYARNITESGHLICEVSMSPIKE